MAAHCDDWHRPAGLLVRCGHEAAHCDDWHCPAGHEAAYWDDWYCAVGVLDHLVHQLPSDPDLAPILGDCAFLGHFGTDSLSASESIGSI